jgi:hypothetical protein
MRDISARQFPHISILKMAVWVAFFVLSTIALMAQPASAIHPTTTEPGEGQGAVMKQFVLIFRQGNGGQISPEERAKRSAEILTWARKWIGEGYSFDPRQLGQESYRIAPDGEGDDGSERNVVNLLFLTAKDFDDAVRVAKTHPGVHFGTHIEVRAWTSPAPLVAR